MATTPTVYALCDQNCKYETLTREQIVTAIYQAVNEGILGDLDAGFITKIQEMNAQGLLQFWVGTTAEYIALGSPVNNGTMYILTDDDTEEVLNELTDAINNLLNGTTLVPRAAEAETATKLKAEFVTTQAEATQGVMSYVIFDKGLYAVSVAEAVTGSGTMRYTVMLSIEEMPTSTDDRCIASVKSLQETDGHISVVGAGYAFTAPVGQGWGYFLVPCLNNVLNTTQLTIESVRLITPYEE